METIESRIMELKIKGNCCSQLVAIIVGLNPTGEENESLVRALRGLCMGMYAQSDCGALSGGVCALSLHVSGVGVIEACRDLTAWFEGRFGSLKCRDIIGFGTSPALLCMDVVKETCEKCFEILTDMDCL
jgi:hypothetical protein